MTNTSLIAVSYTSETQRLAAEQLAGKLQLPLAKDGYPLLLAITEERIELQQNSKGAPGPIFVDFLAGKNVYRSQLQNLKNELIARAIHIKGQPKLRIIDATAGLGQDAFIMASLGHDVKMIERSPIVATLLADGLKRLQAQRPHLLLSLITQDALSYLTSLSPCDYPDVVYLDPMFPERTKSALVKKEMRILQQLVGQDLDASPLLSTARQIARYKVVVKRPRLAPFLGNTEPSFCLQGKVGRFDIYQNF